MKDSVSHNLNALGAKLALAVIRKEMTPQQAARKLQGKTKPCMAGPNGVCLTHGQSLTECK